MTDLDLLPLACLVFGVALLVSAARVRLGASAGFRRVYLDPTIPLIVRQSIFGALPGGLAMLLFGAAILPTWNEPTSGVFLAMATAAIVAMFAGLFFVYWPPRPLKPRWLRDEEAARAKIPLDWFDWLVLALIIGMAAVAAVSLATLAIVST